jgi:hypothetical protein
MTSDHTKKQNQEPLWWFALNQVGKPIHGPVPVPGMHTTMASSNISSGSNRFFLHFFYSV